MGGLCRRSSRSQERPQKSFKLEELVETFAHLRTGYIILKISYFFPSSVAKHVPYIYEAY